MSDRFDAFVIFAEMRTGSNYLEATLNDLPDLKSYGEVYNPTFMGHHKTFSLFGIDMEAREKDPVALFEKLLENTDGLPGLRFFHDHDPRVLERILPDPRIAKVILTRNPLESYVSRKIAAETGQWRLTDMKHQRSAQIAFDAAEFAEMLGELQDFQLLLQRELQTSGQSAFFIRYEDINDVDVINGLARFLGSKNKLEATSAKLKKQNPSDLSEKVANYEEMKAALAGMDRFDLSRTPNFEPSRPPGVPGFVALPETGVLFMPVRGALVDPVVEWLAGLEGIDPGAVLTRMNQKDLRKWMRKHTEYRSFTILRHPVARAYACFNTCILPNDRPGYSDARRVMRKMYGLPIPEKGMAPGYTAEDHRTAFLAFLTILKGNLAGQTSLKVDAAWATQTALLQGMAQVTLPDLILREEEVAKALPDLALRLTGKAAPFSLAGEAEPFPLKSIYNAEVEDAAADVYRRDYLNFGFPRWNRRQAA